MSNILTKLAGMNKSVVTDARVEMTPVQFEQCKAALRRDNRGYNVHPNKFDMANPYRVAINYQNAWSNFGNFKCADTAAAIGSIVSAAYFGEKAKSGEYNPEIVANSEEFQAWIEDSRNEEVIAMADPERTDKPCVAAGGVLSKNAPAAAPADDVNPF